MPHRDSGFEQALRERPADAGLRLVYADWLDERGEAGYAWAHRWLAGRDGHPLECRVRLSDRRAGPRVAFFAGGPAGSARRRQYAPVLLPEAVFAAVTARARPAGGDPGEWDRVMTAVGRGEVRAASDGEYWVYFPSSQVAVEELAEALGAGERGTSAGRDSSGPA